MHFALHAVGCGSTARPEVLAEVARTAESLGFESAWIPEHGGEVECGAARHNSRRQLG